MTPSMAVNLTKTVAEISPEKMCEWLAELSTGSGDKHLNAWSIAYSIHKAVDFWLDDLEASSINSDLVHICGALCRAATAGATDITVCLPEQNLKRNVVPSAPLETCDLTELISTTGPVRRWNCDTHPAWLAPAAWPAVRFVYKIVLLYLMRMLIDMSCRHLGKPDFEPDCSTVLDQAAHFHLLQALRTCLCKGAAASFQIPTTIRIDLVCNRLP